jgi:phospholipid transport system transporter-binding protein
MARATAQLADRGEGRCVLSGALTLETAPWLWQQLRAGVLLNEARTVELSEVTDADSAGLALLLTWRASCKAAGADLRFANVPQRLIALARLTGAQTLLSDGAPSA